MTKKEILKGAYKKWGVALQFITCIEEMAELTQALSKWLRGQGNLSDITEEVADVLLTIEGIINHLGIKKGVLNMGTIKLKRLEEHLK